MTSPACHVRVHKVCREDRDRATERVADGLVDQVLPGNLFLSLLRCGPAGRVSLLPPAIRSRHSVHKSPDVGDVRVCPEVGDPVDGFRPEGRGRDERIAIPEHDERELDYLCLVPFEQVMVSDRVIVNRAVADRVSTFYDMTCFKEVLPLPLDEFAVGRVDGGEPAAPVDRDSACGHHSLVLAGEVADDGERIGKLIEHVLRDFVEIAVKVNGFGIVLCDPSLKCR